MSEKSAKSDSPTSLSGLSSFPKRPSVSRTSSSAANPPGKALVRSKSKGLHVAERSKAAPSESASSQGGSTIYVSTPEDSQDKGSSKNTKSTDKKTSQSEDGEDGSVVLVKVETKVYEKPGSSTVNGDKEPTGQLVKVGPRLSNGTDINEEENRVERLYVSTVAIGGLTKVMKLESQLLLLRRMLRLYLVFDEASGNLIRTTAHDEFYIHIDRIILDIMNIGGPLSDWARSTVNRSHAIYMLDHLRTTRMILDLWNSFYKWLHGTSDREIRQEREKATANSRPWERRRMEAVETVEEMLRLLGDVKLDDGIRGVLDMQNKLRKQWRTESEQIIRAR